MDDGSTKDNTAEIADRYEKEYPGIFSVDEAAQGVKHLSVCLLIDPVITVHDLKIDPGSGL